jgi:hypothetical protein
LTQNIGYLKEFPIFTVLKKIIYILTFIVGLTFTSFAQNKTAGSGEIAEGKFVKCYPIPATTVVYFDFQYGYTKSYTFQVFSFIGKKVYEVVNPSQKISIPLDEFYRGFYYYKLLDKNGDFIESGRFIVVK